MLDSFRQRVRRLWHRALNRRSQLGVVTEARLRRIADAWLPIPRICQPYPEARLRVIIKARARCGNPARRDPCGGRRETAVPTATTFFKKWWMSPFFSHLFQEMVDVTIPFGTPFAPAV
jgi:hypothetical protein